MRLAGQLLRPGRRDAALFGGRPKTGRDDRWAACERRRAASGSPLSDIPPNTSPGARAWAPGHPDDCMLDDLNVHDRRGAVMVADPTTVSPLPVLQAGGFGAVVDAYAWEPDAETDPPKMRLWLVSLFGSQQAVKALWAHLVRAETATLTTESGRAQFCALASQGKRGWRFFRATLPAVGGYHAVLLPEAALFSAERPEFLLLRRSADDPATLDYRFLNGRVTLPLHPTWADWLWAEPWKPAKLEGSNHMDSKRIAVRRMRVRSEPTSRRRSGTARLGSTTSASPPMPARRPRRWRPTNMARLESIARAGYYPTPPRLVTAIAYHLRQSDASGKRTARLLDPCAGTGEAASARAAPRRRDLRHRAER